MAAVLHLLKGGDPALALAAIGQHVRAGDTVTVALLNGAPAPPLPPGVGLHRVPEDLGWDALLDRIFESDQVITW